MSNPRGRRNPIMLAILVLNDIFATMSTPQLTILQLIQPKSGSQTLLAAQGRRDKI